jgi:hypothetical protein
MTSGSDELDRELISEARLRTVPVAVGISKP